MGLILALLGLLCAAAVAAMLFRRHSPSSAAEPPLESLRRRGLGEALVATMPPPLAPPEVVRPRPSLRLTPWNGPEGEEDEDVDDVDQAVTEDERPASAQSADEEDGDEGLSLGDDFVIPRGTAPDLPNDVTPEPHEAEEDPAPLVLMTKKRRMSDDARPVLHSTPSEVIETASAVLRRQVPARGDDVRSWLGGLPRMPLSIDWPRAESPDRPEAGERPLHFVAQVACADLPPALWSGLGPRSGWLLFFLNPLDEAGDDPRLIRVIHSEHEGLERQPPDDLGPVDEELRPGPDYRHVRRAGDIPNRWRRWPVDVVHSGNDLHDDGRRMVASPPDYAGHLYDGATIDAERPGAESDAPLSWRGALYVIDSVLRELDEGVIAHPPSPAQRDVLLRDGYVASIIPELRAQEEQWLADGAQAVLAIEEPVDDRQRERKVRTQRTAAARQDSLEKVAAFIVQNPNAESIIARCDYDRQAEIDWRSGVIAGLEAVREQILGQPLDAPFLRADWDALRAHLDAERFIGWSIEWTSRNTDFPVSLVQRTVSLLDLAEAGRDAAVAELAADYHADPRTEALVPESVRSRLEPYWRHLVDNRPHRMGGYHDGIQTEPEEGPQSELLLLQLASDAAMNWMWGDGGAYYITIAPRDLAEGRFDRARVRLELP